MTNKSIRLATEPIGKLLSNFYFPAFIGVITNALYNIVDRIFIGQVVGAEALSGISITFPIFIFVIAFGMLSGVGSGVVLSIKLGEKNRADAEKVLGNNLFLVAVISVVLVISLWFFKDQLLMLFGATPQTHQFALTYLSIYIFGIPFSMAGFSMNNLIRSEGNARVAMISMLLGSGCNIVLDYLFIVKFGWGVAGAAWATNISMALLSIWVILYFRTSKSALKLHLRNIRPYKKIILPVIGIGVAPFAMQIASSVVNGILNKKLILFGGDLAVGAMGIIMSASTIFIMAIVALNMASQPIIGFNYGAKNYARVRQTLKLSIIWATAISVFAWIVVQLFPYSIAKLFNNENETLIQLASNGLRLFLFSLPLVGFQIISSNFFQSIGQAKISLFLTLLRQVIVLIPLLFILPSFFGLDGIWLSGPISDATSAIVAFFFLRSEWHKLNRLVDEEAKKSTLTA